MLLDNYYKWRGAVQAYGHTSDGAKDVGLLNISGSSAPIYFDNTQATAFNSYALDGNIDVVLGRTAGTISGSDYALTDNTILPLIRIENTSYHYATINNKLTRYLQSTFFNTSNYTSTATDITIAQVGLVKTIVTDSGGSTTNVLIYKKNLEQPITIKAGEIAVIPVEWSESN